MSKRILVPLDHSSFAEFGLARAASIAGSGDRVTLATVVDSLTDHPEYAEPLRKGVRSYHDEVGSRYFGPDVHVRSEVVTGRADHELLRLLEQVEFDVVVAATHGRGPFNRFWMGSVAHALARHSPVPVLLVRPVEGASPEGSVDVRLRRFVVPLDGSDESATALRALPLLDPPEDAVVHLVRVVVPPDVLPPAYIPVPEADHVLLEQLRRSATEYLEAVAASLRREGFRVEVEMPSSHSAATAILETAARTSSDAIVMAARGRGAVSRALLGSVSDKVMRGSSLPLLMVPVPKT